MGLVAILAAGAIMTAVFLGFASDPDVVVKMIGVGEGIGLCETATDGLWPELCLAALRQIA